VLVYRRLDRWVLTESLVDDVSRAAGRLARSTTGDTLERHDAAVGLLIDLGVLEAGAADALCPEADGHDARLDAVRAATLAAAHVVVDSWEGRSPGTAVCAVSEAVGRLTGVRLPSRIRSAVPEGYAFYGLYPEMYIDAAQCVRRTLDPARALIIGLRSIGTSLSALVHATLAATGCPTRSLTVRPRGHPFDRRVRLDTQLGDDIAHAVRAGAHVAVVDEGPGLSGSSIAGTVRALIALGVDMGRIIVLPSWDTEGASLCSADARALWPRLRRFPASFERSWLASGRFRRLHSAAASEDLGAGRWRAHAFRSAGDWPAVQPQHERRKFLIRVESAARAATPVRGEWRLVKFAGLGRYGAARFARADALAATGFTPRPIAWRAGWLVQEFVPGRPLVPGEGGLLFADRCARYLAHVDRAFRTDTSPDIDALVEMVEANVRACRAAAGMTPQLRRLLRRSRGAVAGAPAVAVDGRMLPHEWIRTRRGLLKTDALDHHDDHFFPGPQDSAWDVAACCVELGLRRLARAHLVDTFERIARVRDLARRLPLHLVAYSAYRFGYMTLAAQATAGSDDAARLAAGSARYARCLRRFLAAA